MSNRKERREALINSLSTNTEGIEEPHHTKGNLILRNESNMYFFIDSESGPPVASIMWEYNSTPKDVHRANAARIVKAWNKYDDLVSTCRLVLQSLKAHDLAPQSVKILEETLKDI